MKKIAQMILSCAAVVWFIGCDDTFNPVVNYRDELVVYSVLRPGVDTQYVRVYKTYNPPNYDPFAGTFYSPVTGAEVILRDEMGTTVRFNEGTIGAWDSTRYGPSVHVYFVSGFVPVRGRLYTLSVAARDLPPATAQAVVPGTGTVSAVSPTMLRFPQLFSSSDQIKLQLSLSGAARGFMVRFFVDYEVAAPVPGGWLPQRAEVPLTIIRAPSIDSLDATYPTVQIRQSAAQGNRDEAAFGHSSYRTLLALLWRKYEKPGFIRMKQAVFHLYQVETNLFTYYNVANGFRDELSVRTDEPDFSNIQGGVGLFGSFAVDSVAYDLPSDVGYR